MELLVILIFATSPPPTSRGGYIPRAWNDPIFASVVERTSPISLSSGQSASNMSIVEDSGLPSITAQGSVTLDRIRIRSREGYRGVSGDQYLSNMYIEVTGIGSDHADALQIYSPGSTGRVTLKDSTLINTLNSAANAAYFTANDWMGAHVLENVFLSGGGYTLRFHGDGGSSISLKDVYIEEGSYAYGALSFPEVNGKRMAITRWENVRYARVENGRLVLGAEIPQPYGIVRDYTEAITGTSGQDQFALTTSRNTFIGQNGNDTFRLDSLNQSLFSDYDFITDFSVGLDVIDAPNTQPITPSIISSQPTALTNTAIGNLLNSSGKFTANGAVVFSYGAIDGTRTFLALNNNTAGYSSSEDAIIEITGYSGNIAQLHVI